MGRELMAVSFALEIIAVGTEAQRAALPNGLQEHRHAVCHRTSDSKLLAQGLIALA